MDSQSSTGFMSVCCDQGWSQWGSSLQRSQQQPSKIWSLSAGPQQNVPTPDKTQLAGTHSSKHPNVVWLSLMFIPNVENSKDNRRKITLPSNLSLFIYCTRVTKALQEFLVKKESNCMQKVPKNWRSVCLITCLSDYLSLWLPVWLSWRFFRENQVTLEKKVAVDFPWVIAVFLQNNHLTSRCDVRLSHTCLLCNCVLSSRVSRVNWDLREIKVYVVILVHR